MKKNGRDNRPSLKPVTRIELSEKNTRLRIILAVVFLIIGAFAFATGIASCQAPKTGWQTVDVMSDVPTYGDDFVFMYEYSQTGAAAVTSEKALVACYTDAMEYAYRVFNADLLEAGLNNVAHLNAHPNETVTVDPVLYRALKLIADSGNRHVFLAPAASEYKGLFLCGDDTEASWYDPAQNPDTAAWLKTLTAYSVDPAKISLEIVAENQVRMNVSDDYLNFVQGHDIAVLMDFGWMRNAFVIDYVTGELQKQGFTNGYLSSYDGFTRNLDSRGQQFSFNLFDRQGNAINMPARMHYKGPASIVFLRNYAMSTSDSWHYYTFATGKVVTPYLDPMDGVSKSAVTNLVSYSESLSCAEILLRIADVYIADVFRAEALTDMEAEALHSIWFEGTQMRYTDPDLKWDALPADGATPYSFALAK